MDSRRTGSDELVYIQTNSFSLTIKGSASHPSLPGVSFDEKDAVLRVRSDSPLEEVDLQGEHDLVSYAEKEHLYVREYRQTPVFFEQQQYEIVIEPATNHSVKFWHENFNIRRKVTQTGRNKSLLTGSINFDNNIGFSDLVITVDNKSSLTLTIEVFPTKISYREDYVAIISDITTEVYNLVFDFLKKTYSSFGITTTKVSSMVEFYSIIRKIYDKFISSADMILKNPHHMLISEHEIMPAHKIKETDVQTIKWLQKHPSHIAKEPNNRIKVDKALSVKKYVTYNTKENRLAKYMLLQTAKRLQQFKSIYCRTDKDDNNSEDSIEDTNKDMDYTVVSNLNSMISGIERRCNTGVFGEIEASITNTGMSLVFGMAPGYRELFRCYLLMQHGLSVSSSLFDLSVKDLARLYEYWCFIKLNSILKKKYQLKRQDIIKSTSNGLSVELKQGMQSRVRYTDPKTNEGIELYYNPKKKDLPTGPQKPDNILAIKKYGSNTEYKYVFDAKYRIDPGTKDSDTSPGPQVDTINAMHRYRDAFVLETPVTPYERTMFGAYVLFPYHDEEQYKSHKFYQSIKTVNVGGLPFLPSATTLVENLLDELVSDSADSAFERATLPLGIESRLARVDWSRRDVLVGHVRSRSHLDKFLNDRVYFIEASSIKEDAFPIRYVALYQSKSVFGSNAKLKYYGEVSKTEIVTGFDINLDGEDAYKVFYRFNIVRWDVLSRPIEPRELAQQVMYTNLFLLQHCSQIPELYLKTEEEYRLYYELRRRTETTDINCSGVASQIKVGKYLICFDNGNILLNFEGNTEPHCSITEFIKNPNHQFRRLFDKVMADK